MLDDQLIMELRAQLEATDLVHWDVEDADDVVVRLCAACCLVAGGT